jgi:hypothetical protein
MGLCKSELQFCRPHERSDAEVLAAAKHLLSSTGCLQEISHSCLCALCRRGDYQHLHAGQPVYKQGAAGQAMYIVMEGTCDLYRQLGTSHTSALQGEQISCGQALECTTIKITFNQQMHIHSQVQLVPLLSHAFRHALNGLQITGRNRQLHFIQCTNSFE